MVTKRFFAALIPVAALAMALGPSVASADNGGPVALISSQSIFYLIWVIVGLAMLASANLLNSREGRAIRSLRGGGVMLASLGVNIFRIRLVTFVLAAMLAGLAGWLYAHMNRFVSPAPFASVARETYRQGWRTSGVR